MKFSLEFSLLIDCCRRAFGGGGGGAVQDFSEVEWPLLLRLARFHRVQGLVWAALSKVDEELPIEVAEALAADASKIAADSLRTAVECSRLLEDFTRAGLDTLFVKGLTLGALAYSNPAIKSAVDIDILVADADLGRAAEVLLGDGYRLEEPGGPYDLKRLRAWHGPGKESTWVRPQPHSVVDLHTRLSDHPCLIPGVGLGSRRQEIEVATGIRLPTLQVEELFAYLCVHGASSAWFRLKWITDLAGLVHLKQPPEIERLYDRSQQLGAGRAADQALLLADRLYGTLGENRALHDRLHSNLRSRWLARAALGELAGRREPLEPTARRGGTLTIHLAQFFLRPGARFKASEFVRQARAALR